MIVSIDGYTFDNCFYDREVDVLYLRNGPSSRTGCPAATPGPSPSCP